jgi:hypothetical protein
MGAPVTKKLALADCASAGGAATVANDPAAKANPARETILATLKLGIESSHLFLIVRQGVRKMKRRRGVNRSASYSVLLLAN